MNNINEPEYDSSIKIEPPICSECGSSNTMSYRNTDIEGRTPEYIIECLDCGCTETTKYANH